MITISWWCMKPRSNITQRKFLNGLHLTILKKTMLGVDPTRRRTLRPILRCSSHSSTARFNQKINFSCKKQLTMKSSLAAQERDCRPQFNVAISCSDKWKRRTCNGDHQSPDEEHAWWFHVIEAHLHKEIEIWFERKQLVGAYPGFVLVQQIPLDYIWFQRIALQWKMWKL